MGAVETRGPLTGIRVVELEGRGPGPFGGMILADLGAEVVRIGRVQDVRGTDGTTEGTPPPGGHRRIDVVSRGRRAVALDLKTSAGLAAALRLVDRADVLTEGFRPGAAERLGLGPDVCLERNPRLVYARITGWGQQGPWSGQPGHDVSYVALAGALDVLRRPGQPPVPPLNLVGDYGGGGMLLAVGVLAALVERSVSGRGQVVDAAMIDGVALLTALYHGLRAEGLWPDSPSADVMRLGAPFYNVYETADGGWLSVAASEPPFYAELLRRLGLSELLGRQWDRASWPADTKAVADVFRGRTRDEWTALLDGTETAVAPVLSLDEAPAHPHHAARGTFVEAYGVVQPAPAPRFGRTPGALGAAPPAAGQDTAAVLADWGFDRAEVDGLLANGAARQAPGGDT